MNYKNTRLKYLYDTKEWIFDNDSEFLMVENPERGIQYFSNDIAVSKWIGIDISMVRFLLSHCYTEYGFYTFKWVKASDVLHKYINPKNE